MATNELSSSLPSQITNLLKLNVLSVSYNKLKGTVAAELTNLKILENFHLHGNNFDGSVDLFDYEVKSSIVVVGMSETSTGLVTCSQCSECCNTDALFVTEVN